MSQELPTVSNLPPHSGPPGEIALQGGRAAHGGAATGERADEVESDTLVRAIRQARAEFMEMPGLKLTCAQAARLWALEPERCRTVLTALVVSGFLVVTRDASFVRPT